MFRHLADTAGSTSIPWLEIVAWGSPLVIAAIGAVFIGLKGLYRLAASNQQSANAQQTTAKALAELSERFANFASEVQQRQAETDSRLAVIEFAQDRAVRRSHRRVNEPDTTP